MIGICFNNAMWITLEIIASICQQALRGSLLALQILSIAQGTMLQEKFNVCLTRSY